MECHRSASPVPRHRHTRRFLAGFEELDRKFSSAPATLQQLMETSRDTTWLLELAPSLVQKYKLGMHA